MYESEAGQMRQCDTLNSEQAQIHFRKKPASQDVKKSSKNKKWTERKFFTTIMTDQDQDDQGNNRRKKDRKNGAGNPDKTTNSGHKFYITPTQAFLTCKKFENIGSYQENHKAENSSA